VLNTLIQSVKIATTSLLGNKIQSFLTMLGTIIGVASVIIIMSIGSGAQSLILSEIKNLGTNLVTVIPGQATEDDDFFSSMLSSFAITTLTYEDSIALSQSREIPNIMSVAAYSKSFGTAEWKSKTYSTSLTGTTASHLDVMGGNVEEGRFFNYEEEKSFSRVAVLGHDVKEELFGQSDAVGQKIKLKDYSFKVIGVMEERGVVIMEDFDAQIFMPIKTVQKMSGVSYIGFIRAKVYSEDIISETKENIKLILRDRHGIKDQSGANDDFMIKNTAQALDMITSITNSLKYFLAIMAGLSLAVGGIGIMNIMFISVTERTREIGLRKALGAKNFHVLGQFLIEAIFITVMGGIIGILIGIIFSSLIAVGAHLLGYNWDLIISLGSIILALTVSIGTGLFFGFYPALKASKLNPIKALKYE